MEDRNPRTRVHWSPRRERPWCPGAVRAPARGLSAGPTGWTAFFRLPAALERALEQRARAAPGHAGAPPPALPAAPETRERSPLEGTDSHAD